MNRASPVDSRAAISMANLFVKSGILFVPIPVTGPEDYAEKINQMNEILEKMASDAEKLETGKC